ncbi:MAG TPA: hypothetical protein VK853_07625 [Ilumatobacteraceae bacterium]|nr:hypothetical protein [Ilumatobacteraceae bacterium]
MSTHRCHLTCRHLLALAVVGMLAAACTSEESTTPRPTLTSTTSTTTTVPTTTPTTAPADTTTPPAETTTTPPSTLPAGPADVQLPLLVGGSVGGWLYLGAWEFDTWAPPFADDGTPITPSVGPGTAVTVSNLLTDTTATLGAFTEACFDEREGPTIDIEIAPPDPPGFGYGAIAFPTPGWPLVPRPVAVTAAGPAAYQAIGEAAFAGEPVDASLGTVRQVVVSDLDGDGDDEALVVFENFDETGIIGTPGDLSALLLVDATTRASSTALSSFVPADLGEDGVGVIERFRVIDVADYNGDGRMEVAAHAWYYEGAAVVLFEYDGTQLVEVLSTGCGS